MSLTATQAKALVLKLWVSAHSQESSSGPEDIKHTDVVATLLDYTF